MPTTRLSPPARRPSCIQLPSISASRESITWSAPAKPCRCRIAAINTEEEPFNESLKLTATLTREVNSAVKTQTESGATTTRNDVTEETVVTSEFTLDPAASAKDGQPFIVTPQATGLHFLTIRGIDPAGPRLRHRHLLPRLWHR